MNKLSTDRINEHSPYDVEYDGDVLIFTSAQGVTFAVDFDEDTNPYFPAYWLNLRNVYHRPSSGDKQIAQTVICIVEEFFRQNDDVLLYICSSEDGHQAYSRTIFSVAMLLTIVSANWKTKLIDVSPTKISVLPRLRRKSISLSKRRRRRFKACSMMASYGMRMCLWRH